MNTLEFILMEITGNDLSLILHSKGATEGLAAGSSTNIQHLLPRLHICNQGDKAGSAVLNHELSLPESRQRRQITGAGKLQAARDPRMAFRVHALLRKLLFKGVLRGLQGIILDRHGSNTVVGCKECFRFFPAQKIYQPLYQPLGMAVANREISLCIFIRNRGKLVFVLGDLAQHRIDKSGSLPTLIHFRKLNRLIDCRTIRDFIQIENLVSTNSENIQQRRLEMIRLLGAVSADIKIQKHPVLHHTVDNTAAKGGIRAGKTIPDDLCFQCGIRPGTIGPAAHQDPQSRCTGRNLHLRFPPLRF